MRGLLDELRGLSVTTVEKVEGTRTRMDGLRHLGAVNSGWYSALTGYHYSMPIEIRVGHGNTLLEHKTVRWQKGQVLETVLKGLRGKQCFAAWSLSAPRRCERTNRK
jgi:hypothetical protein